MMFHLNVQDNNDDV